MFDIHSVPLTTLVEKFNFEVAYRSSDYDNICLTVEDVARPGASVVNALSEWLRVRVIMTILSLCDCRFLATWSSATSRS